MPISKNSFIRALFIALIVIISHGTVKAQDSLSSNHIKEQNPELFHTTNIVFGNLEEARHSLSWVVERNNMDLAPHLITAMRYSLLGRHAIGDALNVLTGVSEKKDWFQWMLWQQKNSNIKPHQSYLDFKSAVFYSIDNNFSRFFTPESAFNIRPEEIVWGGVKVDGIPALDNPKLISVDSAEYLQDDDEVFGVTINGDSRAYPLRIMGWHEMFNDVIGGVPVSLAYCTLCGAGILFEGDVEGIESLGVKQPFTFGSSGFLYQSNKLMYDRNTDSLWNQFTGEPVSGKLKDSGISLKMRPVVITSWAEWKKQNPTTTVLSLDTGFRRNYGSGVVYNDYFSSPSLMFPALGDETRTLSEKDQIFGLRLEGGIKAWPIESFKDNKVINDTVGKTNVVLIGNQQTRTIRAYERNDLVFDNELSTEDNMKWSLSEEQLISSTGQKLKRLPGHVSYWFAWAGYLGDETELYKK